MGTPTAFQAQSEYIELGALTSSPSLNVVGTSSKWLTNNITPTLSTHMSLFSFGFNSSKPKALIVLNDDQQPNANAAKVRFIQLFSRKDGTNQDLILSTTSSLTDISAERFTISDIPYLNTNSDFGTIELKEGSYFLTVTDAGDDTSVTNSTSTSSLFSRGKIYDVILFEDKADPTNGKIIVLDR